MSSIASITSNRAWILTERPTGLVGPEHFALKDVPVPEPGPGQMLVKSLYYSMDPTQRGWLNDEESYIPPVAIGAPMRAGGLSQVVLSNHPDFAPGDIVQATTLWQEYTIVDPAGDAIAPVRKVDPSMPLTWTFSAFGITSLTAYFGMLDVAQVREGDVVLISGAAGATGTAACQIARIKGAKKIIGIAGGPEKCSWLLDEGLVDAALDYKNEDLTKRVSQEAPEGIDVFYDNVGGSSLDAALANLAMRARIALCGGISTGYASWVVDEGPKNYLFLILKAAKLEGFLVVYYAERFGEAVADLVQWMQSGKMKAYETVIEGFEKAPETMRALFTGGNTGKLILKVADPD